jgi:hypothetical protein
MCRAVQSRKVKSFLAHFGPPSLVWLAGIYCLYRATQLEGSTSERTFGLGLLLVICASISFSARRSRQTTTRERALETQLQRLTERFRGLERKVDGVIEDMDTDNAAHFLDQAMDRHAKAKSIRLVRKDNFGQG